MAETFMDHFRKIISLYDGAVETLMPAVDGGNAPKGYLLTTKEILRSNYSELCANCVKLFSIFFISG